MKQTMLAAIFRGPHEFEVTHIPVPEVGPDDVLLRVLVCGICGSDLHSYRTAQLNSPGQIMGHEFVGEVVAVGPRVAGVTIGVRVTGFSIELCGECFWCRHGQPGLCPHLFEHYTGYGEPGAFAEYVRIRHAKLNESLFNIPESLDNDTAAFIEPTGVAMHVVRKAGAAATSQVLVLGAGVIGNLIMQALRTVPVQKVVVTEVLEHRATLAKQLGADAVIDARSGDLMAALVQELGEAHTFLGTSTTMADIVIEAAGVPATIRLALQLVRAGGTVAYVALSEQLAAISTADIVLKDPKIVGVMGTNMPKGIAALRDGRIQVQPLISHRFPLKKIDEAFTLLDHGEGLKVLIYP
jgi:threonine dehydrogenase-like Zn-dependent dehydrogenase